MMPEGPEVRTLVDQLQVSSLNQIFSLAVDTMCIAFHKICSKEAHISPALLKPLHILKARSRTKVSQPTVRFWEVYEAWKTTWV